MSSDKTKPRHGKTTWLPRVGECGLWTARCVGTCVSPMNTTVVYAIRFFTQDKTSYRLPPGWSMQPHVAPGFAQVPSVSRAWKAHMQQLTVLLNFTRSLMLVSPPPSA